MQVVRLPHLSYMLSLLLGSSTDYLKEKRQLDSFGFSKGSTDFSNLRK